MLKLQQIGVLLAVVLIPLIAATKEGEFNYDCFGNDKNHKGESKIKVKKM